MRIAIDAMGGDHAPREIVAGAVEGLTQVGPEDQLVLVGQQERITKELEALGDRSGDDRLEIVHASQVIEMGDNPVDALRQKRDSSITVAAELAARKEIDALISAGNTGACVAACQMKIRPLKGVQRPGIVVYMPTFAGPILLCDVGANVAPRANHLYQYALMCSIYARQICKLDHAPRVALLSIGEEDAKGNRLVKEVRDLLKADTRINFAGYVEGRNMLTGVADVVICDGFVGNVVLKLVEGLSDGLVKSLVENLASAEPALAGASEKILQKLQKQHDYTEYGGAPLLGVDGVCIICHGSSDRRAIKNAISEAHRMTASGINERIIEFINSNNKQPKP